MPRSSFVYDKELQKVVDADEYYAKKAKGVKRSSLPSPQVMRDIVPFRNVAIDGKEISSRSHKREMMKQHGLVEVGTEAPRPKRRVMKPKLSMRDSIKRTLQHLGA
jgi:hypothetical protein